MTKSGNLIFLEHFGPVQACNETDLPFYLFTYFHPPMNADELGGGEG